MPILAHLELKRRGHGEAESVVVPQPKLPAWQNATRSNKLAWEPPKNKVDGRRSLF